MAKIKKRTSTDLSAMMSSVVAPKMYRNRLVLVQVANPKESKSKKKENANQRFKEANQYAKKILNEPGMKALYSKGIDEKRSNAHTVAVADYLNKPVIHDINLKAYRGEIGDTLRIKATDDFQVTSVHVRILHGKGKILEQGEAVQYARKPDTWVYTATEKNPELKGTIIRVTAEDRPGNEAKEEVTLTP